MLDPPGVTPQQSFLVASRVPFHLALRGACRLYLATEPSDRTPLRRFGVAMCAAWDIAEAVRLRRDPRLRLFGRLAADLADVALWAAASSRAYAAVPTLGVPLITETALRHQWAAVPLPFLHGMAVAAARRLADKPLQPANLGYQVVAVVCGLGLRRAERDAAQRARTSVEAELRAAEITAEIAGQYRVAAAAFAVGDERINPHDVLSGVRLHFPSARVAPSVLHELTWGGRKAALEVLASERAVQLDTALRAWTRDVNRRRSVLADQVLDATLPEGHGMTLLSGHQVGHLAGGLDALGVHGTLAVRVVEATRPGARAVLEVNGRRLVVPADPPRTAVTRADPTPVAMLQGGILWALLEATEAADEAPLWSTLPGMAAFAALAAWSHRALRERGEAAHPRMLALSALAALVQAGAIHTATRGQPNRSDGTQRVPIQVALSAPLVVAGFCWPSLDPGARRRAFGLFLATTAVGLLLLEPPRWRRDLARNAMWLPVAFLPSLAYRLASDRDVQRARVDLGARLAQTADTAVRRGEQDEWERVARACREATARLDSVIPTARPEVERRLAQLHHLAEEQVHAN